MKWCKTLTDAKSINLDAKHGKSKNLKSLRSKDQALKIKELK